LKVQLIWDDFTWQRPTSRKRGFLWEGTGDARHLLRVPGAAFHAYRPHPGIFRDFAGLQPTPAAVLTFANRYGALRREPDREPFSFWRQGILQMAALVRLSDAVSAGDWKKIPEALEPFLADAALATAADIRPLRQKRKRGEMISRNEQVHVAVMRLYHAIAPLERLAGEGSWNSVSGAVEVRLKPADLLGYLFLQLGVAFLEGRRFRQCPGCGKWWLLAPGVNRADRSTCSGYCRLKLYRQRRAQAVVLHQQGWVAEEIAKEIGSEVSKVKSWLAEAKG
jgi:hypothetical protein